MNGLTTHILDVARGLPATGVVVRVALQVDNVWHPLSQSTTDEDGRARLLSPTDGFGKGIYQLTFEVEAYFESIQTSTFYPVVEVVFKVQDERHYHVPLLLSPFGYSTYRGT
ncbi:hydroxyisourate hydrolase [bacterium]|nr:MAG: hydroxyisourate hydrolase [bacterium]